MKTVCIALLCFGIAGIAAQSARGQDLMAGACTDDSGPKRAYCVAMIGTVREVTREEKTVCSPNDPNDLSDTHAVIDFIRAHPERQRESIGSIAEDVLKKLHPCP